MLKQYIASLRSSATLLSLLLVSLLTACSSSHTDKIKQQLGKNFDSVTYENAGGEVKSKDRYDTFCKAIKEKKYTKIMLQDQAINSIKDFNDLRLVNAEIKLADKDCK